MALKYTTPVKTSQMTNASTQIGANAIIAVYSGAPPGPGNAATGTLLAQFAGNAGGFGTVSAGILTASAVANTTGLATGTAGYVRISTSGGTAILEGTVTATGGGGDFIISNVSIATSQVVTFTSFTLQNTVN